MPIKVLMNKSLEMKQKLLTTIKGLTENNAMNPQETLENMEPQKTKRSTNELTQRRKC